MATPTLPLMPKATAVWLVDNTTLNFEQIAAFCGMHPLEIQGIADGEVAGGIMGQDPVAAGQLTRESIAEAEADPEKRLVLAGEARQYIEEKGKKKGGRYTPVARRQAKPDAISWLVKHYPQMPDAVISRLIGTTKPTIQAVRTKSHWNSANLKPQDPVLIGLCTQTELDAAVAKLPAPAADATQLETPLAQEG